MSRHGNQRRVSHRGTILVASRSPAFIEIVDEMILDCGFAFATAVPGGPAWRSVRRTQPALVICDGRDPADDVKHLMAELLDRRLPLLVLGMADERASARVEGLPSDIRCLQLPLARDAFRAAIDELSNPAHAMAHQLRPASTGLAVDAGFATRSPDAAPPRSR